MSPLALIRSVDFSAGHRYWRPSWSEERNRRTFGPSANPHGHNYRLEVRVEGTVDDETGFLVDLGELDSALAELVDRLDQQDVGEALPEFGPGGRVPTTEELARWLFHHLAPRVPSPARLTSVRLEESRDLAAEYVPGPEEGAS